MKSQSPTYTKMSLVAHFLRGCKRFFVFSILMSFINTLLEMLIPQVIRQFVDSVIGTEPFNVPAYVMNILTKLAGAQPPAEYLREHMYLAAILIGILALFVALAFYGTHQSICRLPGI